LTFCDTKLVLLYKQNLARKVCKLFLWRKA